MYVRKCKDMNSEFRRDMNNEKLQRISKEIDILLSNIDSAIKGQGKAELEEIENQLLEIQNFVLSK